MRLSEVMGARVTTDDGRHLGRVRDVRLVQDGPTIGEWGASLRLHELVVGHGSVGARLGYRHGGVRAPWLVRMVFGRGRPVTIPWEAVRESRDDRIVVDGHAVPSG